jgi:gliding motility-associated-like protein
MRIWFCVFLIILIAINAGAQTARDNRKPKIVGQNKLMTDEDQPITIKLTDLEVKDKDNWFYPIGFTLRVYDGNNYTVNGNTVTPALNLNGKLYVTVTVNNGEDDSEKYNVEITVNPVNDAPVIVSQYNVSTNEDQPFTIQAGNMVINDPDDTQFTFEIKGGTGYTVSGNVITPDANFNGVLSIPVSVNDGKLSSNVYNLQLTVAPVNDPPKITGQQPIETDKNKPITIQLSDLTVVDPDDTYPNGFSLSIKPSADNSYSVEAGNVLTPGPNYEGTLSVGVTVNDGASNSEVYILQIKVNPGNTSPSIVSQFPVSINEDESVAIQFSTITVTDPDNTYPNGFLLRIQNGTNYTISDNVVMPVADFNGTLSVVIVVSDGTSDSAPFNLIITVKPVNDPPKIINLETDPLALIVGKGPVLITQSLEVKDVDNDSLVQAEIGFRADQYRPGADELIFESTLKIKGVFDIKKGIIILAGKAPVSEYVQAVRSVKYNFKTGVEQQFENKSIYISVNDGSVSSEKAERQIKGTDIVVSLDIPTAFTPNGDLANDTWKIKPIKSSDELAKAVLRIYNKAGSLLFETVGFAKDWDGRLNGELLPADTYFFTIDLGVNYSRTNFKGIVTILR